MDSKKNAGPVLSKLDRQRFSTSSDCTHSHHVVQIFDLIGEVDSSRHSRRHAQGEVSCVRDHLRSNDRGPGTVPAIMPVHQTVAVSTKQDDDAFWESMLSESIPEKRQEVNLPGGFLPGIGIDLSELQRRIVETIRGCRGKGATYDEISASINRPTKVVLSELPRLVEIGLISNTKATRLTRSKMLADVFVWRAEP